MAGGKRNRESKRSVGGGRSEALFSGPRPASDRGRYTGRLVDLLMPCGSATTTHGLFLSEWPERWMGEEKDLPPGRRLVEYFMPFLLHLAGSGLSDRKSTRLHSSHL